MHDSVRLSLFTLLFNKTPKQSHAILGGVDDNLFFHKMANSALKIYSHIDKLNVYALKKWWIECPKTRDECDREGNADSRGDPYASLQF